MHCVNMKEFTDFSPVFMEARWKLLFSHNSKKSQLLCFILRFYLFIFFSGGNRLLLVFFLYFELHISLCCILGIEKISVNLMDNVLAENYQ